MADISFKNPDGSARNTPRLLDGDTSTDTNVGAVNDPVEEVDVSAIQQIEEKAKAEIEALLHHESEPTNG